jgi:hypothetical protein
MRVVTVTDVPLKTYIQERSFSASAGDRQKPLQLWHKIEIAEGSTVHSEVVVAHGFYTSEIRTSAMAVTRARNLLDRMLEEMFSIRYNTKIGDSIMQSVRKSLCQ